MYELNKTQIQDSEESEPEESTSLSRLHDVLQAQPNDTMLEPFDIGKAPAQPSSQEIENMLKAGHLPHPGEFPRDHSGKRFPISVLKYKKRNGEYCNREWLVYSLFKKSLFCLPCRLFPNDPIIANISTRLGCWGKMEKLWEKLPCHEQSLSHKKCYLAWRELERRISTDTGINKFLDNSLLSEAARWKLSLERIIDVVLFLGERGLSFRGSSQRIGDLHNGNFLGLLELLSHYDPLLREHISKVEESQKKGERMNAHYRSADSQNEFIGLCADQVVSANLKERELAKYFSVMVDGPPDSSHTEQTTFILRYLSRQSDGEYVIQERFLKFVDCNKKTGAYIAALIRWKR